MFYHSQSNRFNQTRVGFTADHAYICTLPISQYDPSNYHLLDEQHLHMINFGFTLSRLINLTLCSRFLMHYTFNLANIIATILYLVRLKSSN